MISHDLFLVFLRFRGKNHRFFYQFAQNNLDKHKNLLHNYLLSDARVAKLVDASASGADACKGVKVRVLSRAPETSRKFQVRHIVEGIQIALNNLYTFFLFVELFLFSRPFDTISDSIPQTLDRLYTTCFPAATPDTR